MRPGSVLLAANVAVGAALGATAPWTGAAPLFAALALTQALLAGGFAFTALRRGLPGGRRGLVLLVAAAALVRAPLLLAPPTLSDDVHRYVVDGRLWSTGGNAWRTAPAADPHLAREPVNHAHLATIYPPFAEGVFTAVAAPGGGARAFRVLFAACDLATTAWLALFLRRQGRDPWGAAIFALHPLAALESAGSGHADALGLAALALAFERVGAGRRGASVLAFAAAVGVKPVALLAVPFLARAWGRVRTFVAVALAAAQYAVLAIASVGAGTASGLGAYLATWRHNDLLFTVLLALGLTLGAAKVVVLVVGAGVVALLAARRLPWWVGYAWAAAAWLLLSPVLHPWYALGLLVAAPALAASGRGPRVTAWALATAVLATYILPSRGAGDTPGFRLLPLSTRVWELAPVLALLAWEAWADARAARRDRWNGRPSAKAM